MGPRRSRHDESSILRSQAFRKTYPRMYVPSSSCTAHLVIHEVFTRLYGACGAPGRRDTRAIQLGVIEFDFCGAGLPLGILTGLGSLSCCVIVPLQINFSRVPLRPVRWSDPPRSGNKVDCVLRLKLETIVCPTRADPFPRPNRLRAEQRQPE